MLKHLLRSGRKKIADIDRHSPGKLRDRHLLSKALHTWANLRKLSKSGNTWQTWDPPSHSSFSWDDGDSFESVSSLNCASDCVLIPSRLSTFSVDLFGTNPTVNDINPPTQPAIAPTAHSDSQTRSVSPDCALTCDEHRFV